MEIDGVYRLGYMRIELTVGPIEAKEGAAFIKMSSTNTTIRWRRLFWRLAAMFCATLDIQIPEFRMVRLGDLPKTI